MPRSACTPPWLPILAAAFTAAFYAAMTWNHGFVYDDHRFIGQTPAVHSLADAAQIFMEPHPGGLPYYRPLTRLTLQLQKAWTGDTPRPFHLFNAALAGAVVLAAYALLRLPVFRLPRWAALPASLLFTLHPIASECIYPADSGRETLLPAFFILVAVRAWMAAGAWATLGALAAFALALFAKEQALVLPLVFIAADWTQHHACAAAEGGPRPPGAGAPAPTRVLRWPRYLAVFAICLVYLWIRYRLYGGVELHLALGEDPVAPLRSFLFGLQSAFAPPAMLAYEPSFAVWFSPWRTALSLLCLAVLAGVLWRQPATIRRLACFWGCWFIVFQIPTAQFIRQEAAYSERYVLVSLLAVVALVATALVTLVPAKAQARDESPPSRRLPARALWLWAAGIAAALTSWHRAPFYRDDGAFYLQWTRTNPDAPVAHMGVGRWQAAGGHLQEAIASYRRAVLLKPDYAAAHHNLGRTLERAGEQLAAIAAYRAALDAAPDFVEAHINLAAALAESGREDEALALCRAALQIQPDAPEVYNNLGGVLARMGRREPAMNAFLRALDLDPTQFQPHLNLAILYAQAGRRGMALQHLDAARQQRPAEPACLQAAAIVQQILVAPR